jgi:hypothetical protein
MKHFDFEHLYRAKESYGSHLCFAIKLGSILWVLSIVAFIHAVFPFLFSNFVGIKLEDLVEEMNDRLLGYKK